MSETVLPLDGNRTSTSAPVRWLHVAGDVQYWLLAIAFAFVSFFPPNLYSLAILLYVLLPAWLIATPVGLWYLVRSPSQRAYAVGVIAALPAVILLAYMLRSYLPFITGQVATVIFFAIVFAYPAIWMTRWLRRINAPAKRARPTPEMMSQLQAGTIAMLIGVSLLMIWLVFSRNAYSLFEGVFGQQWLVAGLVVFAVLFTGMIAIAFPCAVRAMRKGRPGSGMFLATFVGLASVSLVIAAFSYMSLALMHG